MFLSNIIQIKICVGENNYSDIGLLCDLDFSCPYLLFILVI